MKKLLIAFSMVGAGALIACADTGAQSNSVTTNYAHDAWFSASASGTSLNEVGGKFSTIDGSASSFAAKEGKIEIDGDDVSDPVSFVLLDANTKTTDLTRVVFELDASVVPTNALPTSDDLSGAKTAFALCKNGDNTKQFYAWVGATPAWTSLNFTSIPVEDETYTLTMRFDDTAATPKVQFAVMIDGVQNEEVSDWYTYGGLAIDSKPQIDFVGCGKLKSMNADQVAIVSAEINFDGGKVTIAEKDADAMGKLVKGSEKIEDVLKKPVNQTVTGGAITIDSSCPLSTAEAYAIGLIANEGGTMVAKADGTFKVKAEAQALIVNDIPVGFVTPLTPNDTTAAFSYQLQGLVDEETGYVNVGGSVSTPDAIKIPTNKVGASTDKDGNPTGKYRYFKVVTTVKLQNAPEN